MIHNSHPVTLIPGINQFGFFFLSNFRQCFRGPFRGPDLCILPFISDPLSLLASVLARTTNCSLCLTQQKAWKIFRIVLPRRDSERGRQQGRKEGIERGRDIIYLAGRLLLLQRNLSQHSGLQKKWMTFQKLRVLLFCTVFYWVLEPVESKRRHRALLNCQLLSSYQSLLSLNKYRFFFLVASTGWCCCCWTAWLELSLLAWPDYFSFLLRSCLLCFYLDSRTVFSA